MRLTDPIVAAFVLHEMLVICLSLIFTMAVVLRALKHVLLELFLITWSIGMEICQKWEKLKYNSSLV